MSKKQRTAKPKSNLVAKKKTSKKTKGIAIRLFDQQRSRLERAVEKEMTSITDFAIEPIMEKVDRVLGNTKPHLIDVTPDHDNLPKFYFRSYLDDINRIKKDGPMYGGLVGAAITSIILYNQLRK